MKLCSSTKELRMDQKQPGSLDGCLTSANQPGWNLRQFEDEGCWTGGSFIISYYGYKRAISQSLAEVVCGVVVFGRLLAQIFHHRWTLREPLRL